MPLHVPRDRVLADDRARVAVQLLLERVRLRLLPLRERDLRGDLRRVALHQVTAAEGREGHRLDVGDADVQRGDAGGRRARVAEAPPVKLGDGDLHDDGVAEGERGDRRHGGAAVHELRKARAGACASAHAARRRRLEAGARACWKSWKLRLEPKSPPYWPNARRGKVTSCDATSSEHSSAVVAPRVIVRRPCDARSRGDECGESGDGGAPPRRT